MFVWKVHVTVRISLILTAAGGKFPEIKMTRSQLFIVKGGVFFKREIKFHLELFASERNDESTRYPFLPTSLQNTYNIPITPLK